MATRNAGRKAEGREGPVNKRRQLVDGEIYNVATELFTRKGYGNTSLQDIADAMGLSRPSLYHYVRSKEDILARLVKDFTEVRAAEHSTVTTDPALDAPAKLRHLVASTVQPIAEHPLRFRLLDRSENDLPAEMLKKHRAGKRAVRDAFVSVVAEGTRTGRFRPVDPVSTAFALIGMCTWVAWWFNPAGQEDVARVVASITDLALQSVLAGGTDVAPAGPAVALRTIRHQLDIVEAALGPLDQA
ncbi:TetR/AcrR family transcriptional regulator [Sphingomonas profundi]|uniref:TetR/AcrR family transcriptional regulator n=1 Tax=Alterirhizorhabdus profundi TaxID=2681549 RepID=UPI0018D01213|nr:TetR/AcrR family transcriptional regulator [Sphingomonas profundi]